MNYEKRKKRKKLKKACSQAGVFLLLCVFCICGVILVKKVLLAEGSKETYDTLDTVEGEESTEKGAVSWLEEHKYTETKVNSLILVNKDNPLPENYEVPLKSLKNGQAQVADIIYDSLSEMLTEGNKEGLSFTIASGFRDRTRQVALLQEDVDKYKNKGMSEREAYEEATRTLMPPGCSEHESGLAVDIVATSYQMLDEGQEQTLENIWLRKHAGEYGFILRYPKDKVEITNIDYESWHYRYVGKEAANYMKLHNLCLEEYISLEKEEEK